MYNYFRLILFFSCGRKGFLRKIFLVFFFFLLAAAVFTAAEEPVNEFLPVHEVFFVHDTDALGGKGGLREVTVVGLVVSAQTEFPVLGEQPDSFEVTYKVGVTHGVFAVAEVTVDYQSIVQQTAGQDGFGFYIAPAFFSGSKVVPTFQFWLSMTCESILFNWPDRVLKASELVASV